jgi:hypothetical protein
VLYKLHQTLHKLGAPTVVLRSIIQIDDECGDLAKALSYSLPPIDQTIYQTITGHFRGHAIEKDLIKGGQENTDWCHCGLRLKIMVGSSGWDATLASSRKWSDLDCRLGIHRDP